MSSNNKNEPRERNQQTRIEEHVALLVDAAPPLTPEQRDRLALLLRGAGVSS